MWQYQSLQYDANMLLGILLENKLFFAPLGIFIYSIPRIRLNQVSPLILLDPIN